MTYLRNCWYVAGVASELTDRPLARTFLDVPVVLYRTQAGDAVALDQFCPHRFAPLDQGKVVGDTLRCPYHGLAFDRHGICVHMPSGAEPPPRATLRSYPVVSRHQLLWIWMGDAAAADPASIPDFSYLEAPGFGWFDGYLYVKGNYQLLVDNLLDLTHAEFLHPALSSEGWTGRNRQTIEQEGDQRITVLNLAENDNILPIMRQMRPDMEPIGTTKQEERWDAPSLLRLSVEFYAAGEQIIIPSGHFLTPETAVSTHYFVRGGHDVGADDPAFTAGMKAGVLHIFSTEDVPMIEAQQRFLGSDDLLARAPAILKTDSAAVRARRVLAKRIRQEQAAAPPVAAAAAAAAE